MKALRFCAEKETRNRPEGDQAAVYLHVISGPVSKRLYVQTVCIDAIHKKTYIDHLLDLLDDIVLYVVGKISSAEYAHSTPSNWAVCVFVCVCTREGGSE